MNADNTNNARVSDPDWVDEGIVTTPAALVIDFARKVLCLQVTVFEDGTIDFGELTDEQDKRLSFFVQVVTDEEYYR